MPKRLTGVVALALILGTIAVGGPSNSATARRARRPRPAVYHSGPLFVNQGTTLIVYVENTATAPRQATVTVHDLDTGDEVAALTNLAPTFPVESFRSASRAYSCPGGAMLCGFSAQVRGLAGIRPSLVYTAWHGGDLRLLAPGDWSAR